MDVFDWKELERLYGNEFKKRVEFYRKGRNPVLGYLVRFIAAGESLSLEEATTYYKGHPNPERVRRIKVDRIVVQRDDGHYIIGPQSMTVPNSNCWIRILI